MLKLQQIVHGTIQKLDENGNGLLFCQKNKVLVRHALLHEEIDARIIKESKQGYIAEIVHIQQPSHLRVKPPCPHAAICGGCQLQHMAYPAQLEWKKQQIIHALKKERLSLHIHDVMPSDREGYRNKMIIGFSKDSKGKIIAGLYEEYSHRIVPYQNCLLHPKECDEIIPSIVSLIQRLRIEPFDRKKRRGILRHVQIRYGKETKQILLTFVVSQKQFPGQKQLVQQIARLHPNIRSIVFNVNTRDTSVVLGKEEWTAYGKGWIEDRLLGKTFRISSTSFYQINHDQCERLYQKAYELLQPRPSDRILDAYCGIGTIGLCIASKVKQVIGVEVNQQAVMDAGINAKNNQIHNARFIAQDASRFMLQEAKRKQHYDAIILDPPREGSTPVFLDACVQLKTKKIVYISCNPFTQLRDIAYLAKKGYACKEMFLYDMFPMSAHVETVVLLSKLNTKQHIEVELNLDELDLTAAESKATYDEIKAYVLEKYGLKVSSLYISQIKRKCGLDVGQNYNLSKKEDAKVPQCPPEKEAAIIEALKHFQMI